MSNIVANNASITNNVSVGNDLTIGHNIVCGNNLYSNSINSNIISTFSFNVDYLTCINLTTSGFIDLGSIQQTNNNVNNVFHGVTYFLNIVYFNNILNSITNSYFNNLYGNIVTISGNLYTQNIYKTSGNSNDAINLFTTSTGNINIGGNSSNTIVKNLQASNNILCATLNSTNINNTNIFTSYRINNSNLINTNSLASTYGNIDYLTVYNISTTDIISQTIHCNDYLTSDIINCNNFISLSGFINKCYSDYYFGSTSSSNINIGNFTNVLNIGSSITNLNLLNVQQDMSVNGNCNLNATNNIYNTTFTGSTIFNNEAVFSNGFKMNSSPGCAFNLFYIQSSGSSFPQTVIKTFNNVASGFNINLFLTQTSGGIGSHVEIIQGYNNSGSITYGSVISWGGWSSGTVYTISGSSSSINLNVQTNQSFIGWGFITYVK